MIIEITNRVGEAETTLRLEYDSSTLGIALDLIKECCNQMREPNK